LVEDFIDRGRSASGASIAPGLATRLKKTSDTHVARAKADIDADVATVKASVDDSNAKFMSSAKK
jgi:hypothetical protein